MKYLAKFARLNDEEMDENSNIRRSTGIADKIRNNTALWFFALCWLMLSTQITAFLLISKVSVSSGFVTGLWGVAEALIILSPYLVIGRKWRWTMIFPMLIVPVFLYANILYARWFPDLMAFSLIANAGANATGTVAEGALSCINCADLWIGIPFLIFLITYGFCVSKIADRAFGRLFKYWAVIAVCIVFFVEQLALIQGFYNKYDLKEESPDRKIVANGYYRKLCDNTRREQMRYYGLVPYIALQLYELTLPKYIELSPQEETFMENYLATLNSEPLLVDSLPDNSGKNLVFVVVESLNTDALCLEVNGRPVMPYFAKLLQSKNIIRMDSVLSQVGIGRSSDGRFIYQTGLLPDRFNPVALKYMDYEYPSISSALNRESVEFDGGDPLQWNKRVLSSIYGFSELRMRDEMIKGMRSVGGKDPAMFRNAWKVIETLPEPFYVAINTMDMHDPYDEWKWKKSDVWDDTSIADTEKVYVEKCRQFAAGLSFLVAELKKSGKYDNTVIVIAGDHNSRITGFGARKFVNRAIPLIILNSGVELRSDAVIGQSDIYPTVLDVMGVKDAEWRGVGRSIFRNPEVMKAKQGVNHGNKEQGSTATCADPTDPYTYPSPDAWRVSDLYIRSARQRVGDKR